MSLNKWIKKINAFFHECLFFRNWFIPVFVKNQTSVMQQMVFFSSSDEMSHDIFCFERAPNYTHTKIEEKFAPKSFDCDINQT